MVDFVVMFCSFVVLVRATAGSVFNFFSSSKSVTDKTRTNTNVRLDGDTLPAHINY